MTEKETTLLSAHIPTVTALQIKRIASDLFFAFATAHRRQCSKRERTFANCPAIECLPPLR
jgi:uncharacterized ParB-like nuclease family protein